MINLCRWGLFIALLCVTATGFADARQNFDKAYTIYRKYFDGGEWQHALTAAEDTYQLGAKAFGKDDINTANLAFNYGRLLNRFKRYDQALPVLKGALAIMEQFHGKDATDLIDPLIELGKASYDADDDRVSLHYFNRAADLAQREDPMARAMINMEIGLYLSNSMGSARSVAWLQRAHKGLINLVGPKNERTAIVQMQLAKWQIADGQYQQALDMLQIPLEVFRADKDDRGLEVATRAFVVQALEPLGRHDEATPHCLAISRITGTNTTLPLVHVQPEYPSAALELGRNGWVDVEFTVDKAGYVQDAKVVDTSSKVFNDAALVAARQFRYAPRVEEGHLVATTGVRNRISFGIVAGQ